MEQNILVIGNGGREHALAWKAAQSLNIARVFVAPGNAGTARAAKLQNIPIAADDIAGLLAFAQAENIALTIVGPEAPLAMGVVDAFRAAGLCIFGPTQAAAQLEASKAFTKDFLARHHIPTAFYGVFTEIEPALAYIQQHGAPIVVKADGLAAGKGVVVADTIAEAEAAVHDMLAGNRLGAAGSRVVIEEFLVGEEASFIVVCDGENAVALASAQDHKRIFDHDQGPNTGGMGAYSPAPVVTPEIHAQVMETVIYPTLRGMASEGIAYTGFLYAGLMIDTQNPDKHSIKVLEFNARMGDPETQPILLRLQSDLVEFLTLGSSAGGLKPYIDHQKTLDWDVRPTVGVVMAAAGYPADVQKGDVIAGLAANVGNDDVQVFHAGTQLNAAGEVITNGGRVLCVTALGADIVEAQKNAYAAVKKISWAGVQYRTDIAWRAIGR